MTGCGFTPTQVDELTWWEVEALTSYWRDFPPPHEALKLGFGIERKEEPATPAIDPDDPSGIGGLIRRFPAGQVRGNR